MLIHPGKKHVDAQLVALKERLREPIWWFPIPLFLPFALVLVLTSHVLSGTNPRMGNPADIITFPSETRPDSALWLSITPIGDQIVVTSGDRHVFRWGQHVKSLAELEPFVQFLKARGASEVEAAGLLKQAFSTQVTAVLAADQRLKFVHVRPILYALAAAGISRYAFETQNPSVAAAQPAAEPGAEAHAD